MRSITYINRVQLSTGPPPVEVVLGQVGLWTADFLLLARPGQADVLRGRGDGVELLALRPLHTGGPRPAGDLHSCPHQCQYCIVSCPFSLKGLLRRFC
jgi:hypothetical protein